ncbi:MAG: hypothetical protein FJY86_00035 [Candidatus Diapherotrites archaeon]|uniref:Uncharacterized protein n=1 Tax=Candidatus Iainarchaeum sp. TaxID=3101447 RepID=A0A8T4C5C0_9ARCH|nr:hypothetical protein [Candidatus Diapherotrites archaeon]
MKSLLMGFIFVFLFSISTHAQPINASQFLDASFDASGNLLPEVQGQLSFASQQFSELPAPVKAIFGNQRVQVNLTRNDGVSETLGVVLSNNEIVSFTRYAPTNPSMVITTDEATILGIAQSENISNAFIQAVNSGKLTYSAVQGGGGEFAVFIANIVTWIMTVINAIMHALGLS